jgi:hypothetical protein
MNNNLKRVMVLVVLLILSNTTYAEIYENIGPCDTYSDLKQKFPNATFEKKNPAWATDKDLMCTISGVGIIGTIVVKFQDNRAQHTKKFEKIIKDDIEAQTKIKTSEPLFGDDSLVVEWVRWVPDSPIPIQRFISKYGKWDGKGYYDQDLAPYREWKRGIAIILTEDEKKAISVNYHFTTGDYRKACKK